MILDTIHKFLQYIPHLGIMASIAVLAILAISGNTQLVIYASLLLIPVIFVCILFLRKKNKLDENLLETADESLAYFSIPARTFSKLYLVSLLLIVSWLLLTNQRDWVFITLIVLMFGVSIVQIFATSFRGKAVVTQLIITSLILVLSKQFCYYYYNNGDSMAHVQIATSILYSGGVNISELLGGYASNFFSHITIVATSLVTDLSLMDSLCISITIPIIVGGIFIYSIAHYFTQSDRVSALATFAYFMSPIVFEYAWKASPRTLATLAFVMLLYLIFKKDWNIWIVWGCATLITIYMIMVHHAQWPLFLVVMTILLVTHYLYQRFFSKTQIGVILIFYLIPALYYLYTYLQSLIKILKSNVFDLFGEIGLTEVKEPSFEGIQASAILHISPGVILVIFILCGIFYILLPENLKKRTITLWVLGLCTFPLFLPGVTSVSAFLSSMEQIGRLQIVLAPIFAVIIAIGVVVFLRLMQNTSRVKKFSPILLMTILVLLVVASPIISNSGESAIFDGTDLSSKSYFDEKEITMFTWFSDNTQNGTNLYTDYEATRYFSANSKDVYSGLSYYTFPAGMPELFSAESVNLHELYLISRDRQYAAYGLSMTLYGGNNAGFDTVRLLKDKIDWNTYTKNTLIADKIYSDGDSQVVLY